MTREQKDKKAKDLGAVKVIEFEDEKIAYLKKPNRYVLGIAFSKLESNPVEANEILIKNCIIPEVSDMDVMDNDDYFLSLMQHAGDLLQLKKSTSKAL
jgi:hypothetical protein